MSPEESPVGKKALVIAITITLILVPLVVASYFFLRSADQQIMSQSR